MTYKVAPVIAVLSLLHAQSCDCFPANP